MKKLIHILALTLTLLSSLAIPAYADGGEPVPTTPPKKPAALRG